MKVSVSLPEEAIEFLDRLTASGSYPSRSSAVQAAIGLLRSEGLEGAYGAAWTEWQGDEDRAAWDSAAADGLDDRVG